MSNVSSRSATGPTIVRIERCFNGCSYLSRKWYYRAWSRGHAHYFPLDANPSRARALASKIRGFLRSGTTTVQEAKERFCADQLARIERAKISAVGDILEVLENRRTILGLEESSAYAYQNSLLVVLETVLNARRSSDRPLSRDQIRQEPLDVLNRKLFNDFKFIRQGLVGENDRIRLKSVQRTINKHLRNVKAIFKQAALDVYRDEGLVIPDLADLLATPLFAHVGVEYCLPSVQLIRQVAIAIRRELTDRNARITAILALHAGLRVREIATARWSWLSDNSTAPSLTVRREIDFEPKSKRGRHIPLQRWVHKLLLSHRSGPGEYILEGNGNERREEVFRRLCAWLREHGVTAQKPVHELRKWFGSYVADSYGLTQAQRVLGHRSHQTTLDYYADLEFSPELVALWRHRLHRSAA